MKVDEFCLVVFAFDPALAKVVMVHSGQVPEELEASAAHYGQIVSVRWGKSKVWLRACSDEEVKDGGSCPEKCQSKGFAP